MQSITDKYISTIDFLTLLSWDVKAYLSKSDKFNPSFPLVLFGEFLKKPQIEKVKIEDEKEYKILGVRSYGKGVFANRTVLGKTLKMREYQQAKANHLFWCKVDTKNGAFGVITDELADGVASSNMTFAEIDTSKINVDFLQLLFTCKGVMQYLDGFVTGTTNRKYIRPDQLISEIKIPLPSLPKQEAIVNNYYSKIKEAEELENQANDLEGEIERHLFEQLGLEKEGENVSIQKGLQFVSYEMIVEWGLDKILTKSNKKSSLFQITTLENSPEIVIELFRGKSPKYKEGTSSFILNQKCNRWNEIDLSFVKSVDNEWLKSIDDKFLTKEGDVLINSTGEGTIGRASYIKKESEGLLYDSHLLLLRLNKHLIKPELFVEILNSEYGQNQVNEIKSAQATKQTELGVSNLMKINFPVPDSLEKQKLIIDTIEQLRLTKFEKLNNAVKFRIQAEREFEQTIFVS
jgi:type I restriction enzyme, S subunit